MSKDKHDKKRDKKERSENWIFKGISLWGALLLTAIIAVAIAYGTASAKENGASFLISLGAGECLAGLIGLIRFASAKLTKAHVMASALYTGFVIYLVVFFVYKDALPPGPAWIASLIGLGALMIIPRKRDKSS